MADKAAMTLRLEPELRDKIDQRAARFKMTRTEWIVAALERVVEMPTQVRNVTERF